MVREVLDCLHRYIWDVVIFDSYSFSFLYSLFAFIHEIQARLHSTYSYMLHTCTDEQHVCWKWFFMEQRQRRRRQNIFFSLVLAFFKLYHINRSNVSSYFIEFTFFSLQFFFFSNQQFFFRPDLYWFVYFICFFFFTFPPHGRSFIRTALIDGHCK